MRYNLLRIEISQDFFRGIEKKRFYEHLISSNNLVNDCDLNQVFQVLVKISRNAKNELMFSF